MTLLRENTALFAATETNFGVDALDAYSGSTLVPYAITATGDVSYNSAAQQIDRTVNTGDRSTLPTPVGRGSATLTFQQELRGSGSEDPTDVPDWGENVLSCGMQSTAGTRWNVSSLPSTSGQFFLGEQVTGQVLLQLDSWTDAEGGGGSPVADPSVDQAIVLYPDGKTAEDPEAVVGQLVYLSSDVGGDSILVSFAANNLANRPKNGWHCRVTESGDRYNQLDEDMPVAIVCAVESDQDDQADTTNQFYVWEVQGTFATDDQLAGAQSGIGLASTNVANLDSREDFGVVYRPDSQQTVTIAVGAWNGSPTFPDDVVGFEFVSLDVLSAPAAFFWAGRCTGYTGDASSGTLTFKSYYGNLGNGSLLFRADATSVNTTASADPVQGRGKSRTFHAMIDGLRRRLVGGRGNFSLAANAGETAQITFNFTGTPGTGPNSESHPEGLGFPLDSAPRWEDGIAKFEGRKLLTQAMSCDIGNTIAEIPDANSPDGIRGSILSGKRQATLSFTVLRAGYVDGAGDWETARDDAEWRIVGFNFGVSAGVGNRVAVAFPRLQITGISDGDVEGLLSAEVQCSPRRIGGDDEFLMMVY